MADKGRRDDFTSTTDTGRSSGSANKDKIRAEVENLSRKGEITPAQIAELYHKYGDDSAIVDEFLRQSAKKYGKIRHQAKKLATKIAHKYNDGSRPLHEILDRMLKYKVDNKWSDAEYAEFEKELRYRLTGNRALEISFNQNLAANRSKINRALGNVRIADEQGLNIKESEHNILAKILQMHESSLALHRAVFMHSLMYEDCSIVATTGEFKREKHVASNYIHPILAAMFLPKFEILEIYMLYSNFGNIIKTRKERKPILTEPDALLFQAITSDPNDVVCEINSPITDLMNRFRVQISLWQTVLDLRNGKYYESNSNNEFLTNLNACRNNLYDNADLAYTQDEGSILRRLLSVFSLRPTLIYTKPISSIASFVGAPYGMIPGTGSAQTLFPFNAQPVHTVTSIPMITLQIPPTNVDGAEAKDLKSAITQTIWMNENKMLIPKEQGIIFSNEVMIFYVNRRIQRITIRSFTSPLSFSQLPLTMSNFERLNDYPVNAPQIITLRKTDESYHLRSVVAVTETAIEIKGQVQKIITGSTALITAPQDISKGRYMSDYMLYDPFGASLPVEHPDPNVRGVFVNNKPISRIPSIAKREVDDIPVGFFDRISHQGTIYIYSKPGGYDTREQIPLL